MEWIYSKDKAPSDPCIALDKEALSGRLLPFIASNIAGRKVYGRTAYFGYVDLGECIEAPAEKCGRGEIVAWMPIPEPPN